MLLPMAVKYKQTEQRNAILRGGTSTTKSDLTVTCLFFFNSEIVLQGDYLLIESKNVFI